MNADLAIHRLAFRDAGSLGHAQLLVAKVRHDLELRLLRERGPAEDGAEGARIERALEDMAAHRAQPPRGSAMDRTV